MFKKQASALLATLVIFVSSAFGLGLGDIEVSSNLNDPLEAEIELIQLQGLTAGEILPNLASNEDFQRAGIERSFFLSNIQFRVAETDSGDLVLRLTTSQAVREPFLNFLVELNWPSGRLLKEYTLLLDPPVFDTGLSVDALVLNGDQATELTTTTVVQGAETVQQEVVVSEPVPERDDTLPPGQYRVQRDDTLWEIALTVPDSSQYSAQQVMLAIQDLNPEAFLDGNINRVKAGSVLTLPSGQQIAARTFDEAIAEVSRQNAGGSARPTTASESSVQLSATESTASALPSADEERNPDGYLELSPDAESQTTSASGEATATIDQLQNQLTIAEELNDQFEREREELESRVGELQEQVQILERMLSLQNSDLAEVQQALGQETEVAPEVEPSTGTTTDLTAEPAVELEPVAEQEPAAEPEPVAQPEAAAQPAPRPQPVSPPPSGPDGILGFVTELTSAASSWVTASITNMAMTGGALLLLIMLPIYLRSRNGGSKKTLNEMNTEDLPEMEVGDFDVEDDDILAQVEEEFDEDVETSDELEAIDGVVEAEMYMAYQKFDQAEEKLKEAFAEHPDRADVGVKLLELYSETGDVNAFDDLEARLNLTSDQRRHVADLKAKLPAIGSMDDDDASSSFMESDLDLDISTEEDLNALDSEDAGSELDFSTDLLEEEETPAAESSENLDFSLDLDDLDTGSDAGDEGLDFSLDGLDDLDISDSAETDSTEPFEETADTTSSSALDDGLDFSLDLEESESADASLELDEDLSLDEADSDIELDLEDSAEDSLSLDSFEATQSVEQIPAEVDDMALDIDESVDELPGDDLELDSLSEDINLDSSDDVAEFEEQQDDPVQQLADSLESDAVLDEDEFDFLSGSDEVSTKLDLARAYIEMDDKEGARDILEEVVQEGNDEQKNQAQDLMTQL